MINKLKTFPYYPKYKFTEIKPYTSYVKVGEESNIIELPNILSCKNEAGDSFLYFKEYKRLYFIVENSWITGLILKDIRVNKYNLFNVISGKLRFDIHKQPDAYNKSIKKPYKMDMFGFCVKTKSGIQWNWYDDIKLYNFNIPLSEIEMKQYID